MLSMEVSLSVPPPPEEAEADQPRKKKRKTARSVPTGEINWSLGAYLKREDVEKAFGISGLPRTSKIAPNQPFLHKKVYKYWWRLLAATFLLGLIIMITGPRAKVFDQTFALQPLANSEATQV